MVVAYLSVVGGIVALVRTTDLLRADDGLHLNSY